MKGSKGSAVRSESGEGGRLLKIDIAWKEKKFALDLDGPSHFWNTSNGEIGEKPRKNGPVNAKTSLLKALVWKVIRFSYLEDIGRKKMDEDEKLQLWVDLLEDELCVGVS